MTRLNLPPDIAKQKMMEIQHANQIYSMAFQIFNQQLTKTDPEIVDVVQVMAVAKFSIAAAKFFNMAVQKDVEDSRNVTK